MEKDFKIVKNCEALIDKELKSKIKDIKEALKKSENGKFEIDGCVYEDFFDWLSSYCLACGSDPDDPETIRLELSWGGPADYFKFYPDERIEYWYLDWFDEAHRELEGENFEVMNKVKEYLVLN